jgi:hypothetical protein
MTNTVVEGELSNYMCSCFDPETDQPTEGDPCYGWCWDMDTEMFAEDTSQMLAANTTGWWRVDGIQLWNRTIGGRFHADNAEDLLRGITVDSMWTLWYAVHDDLTLTFSLAHHDAPMGCRGTLRPLSPEECEEEYGYVR